MCFILAIINLNRQMLHFKDVYGSLLKSGSFWITAEATRGRSDVIICILQLRNLRPSITYLRLQSKWWGQIISRALLSTDSAQLPDTSLPAPDHFPNSISLRARQIFFLKKKKNEMFSQLFFNQCNQSAPTLQSLMDENAKEIEKDLLRTSQSITSFLNCMFLILNQKTRNKHYLKRRKEKIETYSILKEFKIQQGDKLDLQIRQKYLKINKYRIYHHISVYRTTEAV